MPTEDWIRILIAEDHPVVREGLVAVIDRRPDLKVVGQAGGGDEAVSLFRALAPDVTLLDLRLPGGSGFSALEQIRRADAGARVIVLTSYDGDEDIYRSMRAGARAYLLKDCPTETLIDTIRAVSRGERRVPPHIAERLRERPSASDLSTREGELLELVVDGRSNREIAVALHLTEGTVKGYLTVLFEKLGVEDRTQAATAALRRGLVRRP